MTQHPPRTLTVPEEMRLFGGLAIQPVLAAGVAFVIFPFVLLDFDGRAARGGYVSNPTEAALGVAIYVFIAALFLTLFAVFPAAVWLLKRRFVTLTMCLAIGFVLANLPIVIITISGGGNSILVRTHTFFSLIGVTCAAVFWTIFMRGRDLRRAAASSPETLV